MDFLVRSLAQVDICGKTAGCQTKVFATNSKVAVLQLKFEFVNRRKNTNTFDTFELELNQIKKCIQ